MTPTLTRSAPALLGTPIPGVEFKRSCVVIGKEVTIDQILRLVDGVVEVSGGTQWWMGDLGLRIQSDKRAEYLERNPALSPDMEREVSAEWFAREYTRTYAEGREIDEGSWRNCVMISRFWPAESRSDSLSFSHHVAAMTAAGGASGKLREAAKWLERAADAGWTAAELRRQVNLSLADPNRPKPKEPEANIYLPLDEADKWSIKHQGDKLDPEYAAMLLVRWQALIGFIEKLKASVAK